MLALLTAVCAVGGAVTSDPAHGEGIESCGGVTLVVARGSGQDLHSREASVFLDRVTEALPTLDVTTYELGTDAHGGTRYPAAGGFTDLLQAEAAWTGPLGGDYRSSVAAGVVELTAFVSERAAACAGELFVLGGYSQGAQVVGEALFHLDTDLRDRTAFVALFGDPKLYLPEGRGVMPAACRGAESPWRRGNVGCLTDNGILEARRPYVPENVEDRTGSWCDRNDPVCNSNLTDIVHSAHRGYADAGAEIDDAAEEIVAAVVGRLPG